MIHIFYHNDADGKASGHIVYKNNLSNDCKLHKIDYNLRFPIEKIKRNDKVYIVDFSLEPEIMKQLLEVTLDVVWIDHHISAIEKLKEYSYLPGLRSTDFSGCELTWFYIYQPAAWILTNKTTCWKTHIKNHIDLKCPTYIRYIGDRDTWSFKFGDKTKAFFEAYKFYGEPEPDDSWWETHNTYECLELGKQLVKYSEMLNKTACESWVYETEFEGYKILVCNSTTFSSELFGDRVKDYPFVSVYCYNGDKYKVSLYSVNQDVVNIAKKYGGGGHPRACGFTIDNIPYKRIEEK